MKEHCLGIYDEDQYIEVSSLSANPGEDEAAISATIELRDVT